MTTLKTPQQLGREVIDRHYGPGTDWEEPNEFGEEGFTRAQAESDIDADDIRLLIQEAIKADRKQISRELASTRAVPGIRSFDRTGVSDLLDAYAEWDGDVDVFVAAWDNHTAGIDFPCPEVPHGVHSTYLRDDGSCDDCGDKNRG